MSIRTVTAKVKWIKVVKDSTNPTHDDKVVFEVIKSGGTSAFGFFSLSTSNAGFWFMTLVNRMVAQTDVQYDENTANTINYDFTANLSTGGPSTAYIVTTHTHNESSNFK